MTSDNHHDKRFWFGFFLGGLLGALLLFFMGTKEGKKKREDLLDALEEKIDEIEKRGKRLKEDVVEEIKEKKEDVTEAAVEKLDTALAHIEKLQEASAETTRQLRHRFFKNLPKRR